MFSALLLTTVFVFILSPTEPQQVTKLKKELAECIKKKVALEEEVAKLRQEKVALEEEVAKLQQDNEDLHEDAEALLEWGKNLKSMGRNIEKDFDNLFEDVDNENRLFEPGTEHTDNCDVSVLNYSLSIKIVNSQGIAMSICIQETSSKLIEPKSACACLFMSP